MLAVSDEDPKKDVWMLTEKKRERLKGVYIKAKMNSLEERRMRIQMEIGNCFGRR